MYEVFIRGYHLVNVKRGKPYYIYNIEMIDNRSNTRYLVKKRYSEFNSLHRALKKDCHPAPFPPKRMRNTNTKVLEERRAALENYMQKMLRLPNTKKQILNFLGIQETHNIFDKQAQDSNKANNAIQSNSQPHHPVLTFKNDPYIEVNNNAKLPDIVTAGVLLGFYKS